ncbi:polysaccharide biosynthesis/export family protein [Sphingopyxis soli]|uniref:Polysaccharide biosynthesis/export family protein n=1 Tax=Sphingopyxis soli TaxID=592051 RepID=A0ABN1M4D2_9SPHN|nr:polysaccharide biosynthesis/export family protein [Sphingopyxis soli]
MGRFGLAFCAAAVLLVSGCASTRSLGGAPGLTVLDTTTMPVPEGVQPGSMTRPYLVGPGDELLVDVLGIDELHERKISTDGEGRMSLPLAGTIDANGLTITQLRDKIVAQMKANYVRDPIVSVNLSEPRSRVVTVDGQVAKPGLYPVVGRMTLMQAVAKAEGTEEFAKLDDVVLFRTIGEDRYAALYNLAAIRRGAYADPEVYPNDTVVVGESVGRRMFQTLVQAGTLIAGPIIALIQRN